MGKLSSTYSFFMTTIHAQGRDSRTILLMSNTGYGERACCTACAVGTIPVGMIE